MQLIEATPSPVSLGAVVWRLGDQPGAYLTVIVKAAFAITPGDTMAITRPTPLVLADVFHGGDPRMSLIAANEIAPFRSQAEVLVNGHAYALKGRSETSITAALVVQRGPTVLAQKTVRVHGDRAIDWNRNVSHPAPFQRIPLVYERALYHPDENPVGVGKTQSQRLPNLEHPSDPSRPSSFGPMPPTWPARARLLGDVNEGALKGTNLQLPRDINWEFFLAAPRDQRFDFLQGDETICLFGLHPGLSQVRTRLPSVVAKARLYDAQTGKPRPDPVLDLRGDMLVIDTDRQVCSVIFRAYVPVATADLDQMIVAAGVFQAGVQPLFPTTVTPIHSAREDFGANADERTAKLELDRAAYGLPSVGRSSRPVTMGTPNAVAATAPSTERPSRPIPLPPRPAAPKGSLPSLVDDFEPDSPGGTRVLPPATRPASPFTSVPRDRPLPRLTADRDTGESGTKLLVVPTTPPKPLPKLNEDDPDADEAQTRIAGLPKSEPSRP